MVVFHKSEMGQVGEKAILNVIRRPSEGDYLEERVLSCGMEG